MTSPTTIPKARKRRNRWWWIIGLTLLLLALGEGWWSLRWPSYDESRVHPKLRGLEHPFRSFRCGFLLDGGTIHISGEDRTGRAFKVLIPSRMGEMQRLELIVVGASYDEAFSGAVAQERLDDDTRRMLAQFIRDYERLDPIYAEFREDDKLPWQCRWDSPLAQDLLKNRFPLRLPK
jgi:hypothetical protein